MPSRSAIKDTSGHVAEKTYEEIMGGERGVKSLSNNLIAFRKWVKDSGCTVHPAVCIVNGEATDGTRNAPILAVDVGAVNVEKPIATAEGRSGLVDTNEDRALYDRTIGCQIRTAREMKEGQVLMTVPKTIMVHPDLIAASDAGRVALACVEQLSAGDNFWDAFSNTREKEQMYLDRNVSSNGTQLLVKIIQERKKVETALARAAKDVETGNAEVFRLAKKGSISTRAVVLLFLIHQRFSDSEEPMVVSGVHIDDSTIARINLMEGTPKTFASYVRTMPPSIALPICWKRNELALLAECIPGISLLQDITGQLMALSSDLLSLIDAGILHRFPSIFSPTMLTWDRWLWAATAHMSRLLPATCYLNKGEENAFSHVKTSSELFYSPPEVWNELGVMVPLIDMLNHEVDEAQIKWESPSISNDSEEDANEERNVSVAQVVVQKKVKKGNQIYFSYGPDSNKELLLKYGFCQIGNKSDKLAIGWALHDAVGNVPKPENYVSLENDVTSEKKENDKDEGVYESLDTKAINAWWSKSRLDVLKHEMRSMDSAFWDSLVQGKKMVSSAYCDGVYHPHMLTAMVVATMSRKAINIYTTTLGANNPEGPHITLNRRHQRILRRHMLFFYTQKLEKLLENFRNGLRAHFNNVNLWTKANEGGLEYTFENNNEDQNGEEAQTSPALGWNSFFDRFAYTTAMEVETHFYALAPDSCVLALYDGNLRAIQESINGLINEEAFKERVIKQLEDLGFKISTDDGEDDDYNEEVVTNFNDEDKKIHEVSNKDDKKRKKDRQRKNKQNVLGIKLHIGNLSYQTTRSRLFDYFGQRYGRENVIDCHIPTERDSGKSRGFGFVTLTETVGLRIISDHLHHEIDGRVLKLAESNTSIEARKSANGGSSGDRCIKCGYRAKYCLCYGPNGGLSMEGGQLNDIYGPGPFPPDRGMYRQGRRSRSLDRWSRSPSPRYHRRGDSRDRMYDRHYRERISRSRSYSRGRDRGRDFRDRDWDRDNDTRRRSRSSKRSKRSSRYSRSRSRSRHRSKSRSRSSRRDRDRGRVKKQSGDLSSNPDSRKLPPQDRNSPDETRSSKRRRSRSRSRDRHSHSPRKRKSNRRSKDRPSTRGSKSRSRSR
jgi:RNA recognition motif-containing protein